MARVFLPHSNGRFDVEDAQRYGALHVIFRRELYPDEIDDQWESCIRRAEDALSDFDPDHDLLCMIGSPLYTALCVFLLGRRHKAINVLRYDRLEHAYYQIPIGALVDLECADGVDEPL